MKKILSSLMVIAIVGSIATQTVSCGPITYSKLLNRRIDTSVYYGVYKSPMTTWAANISMQLDDSIILTNTQDALLATDHYNNFEGDLADKWTKTKDAKVWAFHVREGENAPRWTKLGSKNEPIDAGVIKPKDFFNSFRMVFNPNNRSQVIGIWQGVIAYGHELVTFISNIRDPNNKLYDANFTKEGAGPADEVKSSYFIDRAILAFNLFPEDFQKARDLALDSSVNIDVLVDKSFEEGKMISGKNNNSHVGELEDETGNYNLYYHLAKPAPYFDSIAAFLSFAPLPDAGVDYLNILKEGIAGTKYGTSGFNSIYYSGAYIVSDYNPTLQIELHKNPYYFNKDNVKINKLVYRYTGNIDVTRQRFFFETGDLSEVAINANDSAGWEKYVGSNYLKPKFEGANLVSRPQASSYAMAFNYASTLKDENTQNANKALAQRSVRAFIRYAFNRSELATFYSRAMDNNSTNKENGIVVSKNLRNSWTSKNVGIDNNSGNRKDYSDFVSDGYYDVDNPAREDTFANWFKSVLNIDNNTFDKWKNRFAVVKDENSNRELSKFSDGNDPFLSNDFLGALAFFDEDSTNSQNGINIKEPKLFDQYKKLIGYYDENSINKKMELIKQQVKLDLKKIKINNSVELLWFANGSQATGMNNYIKLATRTFNQKVGADSPIQLIVKESTDASDYTTRIARGEFNIIISGWVSDYADPHGFLHTIVYGGDLAMYVGTNYLFDSKKQNNKITLTVKEGVDKEAYEDLRKRVEHFTNEVNDIDLSESETTPRYKRFSKIENYGFLESILWQPLLKQFLDELPYLSYVNPFSRSTFSSGQAIYRFVGVSMTEKLWTQSAYETEKDKYEKNRNNYLSMYPNEKGELFKIINGQWN